MSEHSLTLKQLKRIENHMLAAKHHRQAAFHHLEIAQHLKVGADGDALDSSIKAKEHSLYAQACEMKDKERNALIESYNKLISHLFI